MLEKIKTDLKTALKGKDETTVSTLRLLLAAIHNKEIELKKRGKLKDEEVVAVIRQQVKQRRESIEAYQKGKRDDLVKKEKQELDILSKYLPQQISSGELEKIIGQTIKETGASSPADFGKVMGTVMSKVKGRAEGKIVAETIKKLLAKQ